MAGVTFSVRLTREERARLVALAEAQGVDPSSLVRSWINQGHGSTGAGAVGVVPPDRSTVPRWALLPREERAIAQAIADATAGSEFGIVLLEDAIDAAVDDGMGREVATQAMMQLTQGRWVDQVGVECDLDERFVGKSGFLLCYGRLSAYALERIPIGSRSRTQ